METIKYSTLIFQKRKVGTLVHNKRPISKIVFNGKTIWGKNNKYLRVEDVLIYLSERNSYFQDTLVITNSNFNIQ